MNEFEVTAKIAKKTSKNGNEYVEVRVPLTDTYTAVLFLNDAQQEICKNRFNDSKEVSNSNDVFAQFE